jgi:hypothetical protein
MRNQMAVAVKDAKHEQWHGWGVLSVQRPRGGKMGGKRKFEIKK